MNSMTLKEFMTRDKCGMEKDAFTINPNWTPGTGNMLAPNAKYEAMTYMNQLNYISSLLSQLTPEQQEALGFNEQTIESLLEGKTPEAFMTPYNAFLGENANADTAKAYWQNIPDAEKVQGLIIRNLEGVIESALPGILQDDPEFMAQLDEDPTLIKFVQPGQKPSDVVRGLMADMTKDSGMRSFLLGLAKNNPGLFKAFAHKYILQGIMSKMGMDPRKVYEFAPGLKAYDMNQHLPGMAAAFGIPFGIGALLGKPGWGALLGLLGAGGYGYYQYNKMQGQQHPFATPPQIEQPKPEQPDTEDGVPEEGPTIPLPPPPLGEESTEAPTEETTGDPATPPQPVQPGGPVNPGTVTPTAGPTTGDGSAQPVEASGTPVGDAGTGLEMPSVDLSNPDEEVANPAPPTVQPELASSSAQPVASVNPGKGTQQRIGVQITIPKIRGLKIPTRFGFEIPTPRGFKLPTIWGYKWKKRNEDTEAQASAPEQPVVEQPAPPVETPAPQPEQPAPAPTGPTSMNNPRITPNGVPNFIPSNPYAQV